ncbi:MAG: DivIVA domain-containing protein [Nitrospirae bacterium]|nr:DivIVA domain-containing protein [Nitrospirota bacterium]
MKLTPMEIRQSEFRRTFTGYDTGQVRALLDVVVEEMERLIKENSTMKGDLRRKDMRLQEMEDGEKNVRETLLTLHKMTQQVRGDAEKEAELIVSRAQLQSETILNDAQQKYNRLVSELQEMRRVKIQFEAAVRSAVDQHLKMLEGLTAPEIERTEDKIRFFTGAKSGE